MKIMKYQFQTIVRWQRTAWQIIVLALLLMIASDLKMAQNEQQPKTDDDYVKRGVSNKKKGDLDAAIQDFTNAIALNPKNFFTYYYRASAYYEKGDYDRAIQDCTQAISINQRSELLYLKRGSVYYDKGDFERAVQDYSQAISLNPKRIYNYQSRVKAFRALGKNELAVADEKKVYELSGSPDPDYNRGLFHLAKSDYDRAIQDFSQAISLNPNFVLAYNRRGVTYFSKGDFGRAIQDYDQAILLDPKFAEAYLNRGTVYVRKDDFERAIQDYDQAILLDPKFAEAHLKRGLVHVKKGDFERAVQDFSQVILLNPNGSSAYIFRESAYSKLGKNDLAKADNKKASELLEREYGSATEQNTQKIEPVKTPIPALCTTSVLQIRSESKQTEGQDELMVYETQIPTNSPNLQLIEPIQVKELKEIIAEMIKPFPMDEIVQAIITFKETPEFFTRRTKSCEVKEKGKSPLAVYHVSSNKFASVLSGNGIFGELNKVSSSLSLGYPAKNTNPNSFDFRLIEISFEESEKSKFNGRFFIKDDKWYRIKQQSKTTEQ